MNASVATNDSAYLLLLIGALFVHACYQLSVSVMTHMSAHSLSRKVSVRRLMSLGIFYTLGVITATSLMLLALISLTAFDGAVSHPIVTSITVVVAPLVGLCTVLLYYRRGKGTQLWLPRPFADYLLERSRKTKRSLEAAALGAITVVGELPMIIAPLLLVALSITSQSTETWLVWSLFYAAAAALPLIFITLYLTSGHSIARVQKWRENNKRFLQWTSGVALVLLTIYLTVLHLGVIS